MPLTLLFVLLIALAQTSEYKDVGWEVIGATGNNLMQIVFFRQAI